MVLFGNGRTYFLMKGRKNRRRKNYKYVTRPEGLSSKLFQGQLGHFPTQRVWCFFYFHWWVTRGGYPGSQPTVVLKGSPITPVVSGPSSFFPPSLSADGTCSPLGEFSGIFKSRIWKGWAKHEFGRKREEKKMWWWAWEPKPWSSISCLFFNPSPALKILVLF